MCGRFYLDTAQEILLSNFEVTEQNIDFTPRYNIAPTQNIITITRHNDCNNADVMRWGLVPSWSKSIYIRYSMFNARAETIDEKSSFKRPFMRSRCLIPASGYYEWRFKSGSKQPYAIAREDEKLLLFAGIWDTWKDDKVSLHSCSIITKKASLKLVEVHDRMPVMLSKDTYKDWLNPAIDDTEYLKSLLNKTIDESCHFWPVSKDVNTPRNDSPSLITPISV